MSKGHEKVAYAFLNGNVLTFQSHHNQKLEEITIHINQAPKFCIVTSQQHDGTININGNYIIKTQNTAEIFTLGVNKTIQKMWSENTAYISFQQSATSALFKRYGTHVYVMNIHCLKLQSHE